MTRVTGERTFRFVVPGVTINEKVWAESQFQLVADEANKWNQINPGFLGHIEVRTNGDWEKFDSLT